MPDESDTTHLTELFRKLGAPDPEGWARSQAAEGIPQLLRWLFLREAWHLIVSEEDPTWIDAHLRRAKSHPNDPLSRRLGAQIAPCEERNRCGTRRLGARH